jgi:hypothetical protein
MMNGPNLLDYLTNKPLIYVDPSGSVAIEVTCRCPDPDSWWIRLDQVRVVNYDCNLEVNNLPLCLDAACGEILVTLPTWCRRQKGNTCKIVKWNRKKSSEYYQDCYSKATLVYLWCSKSAAGVTAACAKACLLRKNPVSISICTLGCYIVISGFLENCQRKYDNSFEECLRESQKKD